MSLREKEPFSGRWSLFGFEQTIVDFVRKHAVADVNAVSGGEVIPPRLNMPESDQALAMWFAQTSQKQRASFNDYSAEQAVERVPNWAIVAMRELACREVAIGIQSEHVLRYIVRSYAEGIKTQLPLGAVVRPIGPSLRSIDGALTHHTRRHTKERQINDMRADSAHVVFVADFVPRAFGQRLPDARNILVNNYHPKQRNNTHRMLWGEGLRCDGQRMDPEAYLKDVALANPGEAFQSGLTDVGTVDGAAAFVEWLDLPNSHNLYMDYWHKQTMDQPLFPDLVWSKPETKQQAGKLLIIGGNQYGFNAPAEAYSTTAKAGVGSIRVLLPIAVKKIAGGLLPGLEFAPNTPSGSFSKQALDTFLEQAHWADSVLLAGDLGRNSETAVLLESFLAKHSGQVVLTKDTADYVLATPKIALNRADTLLVITMAQLRKLATNARFETAFTLGMDLLRLVDGLHEFTTKFPAKIIVKHLDQLIVAVDGQVSTTRLDEELPIWRIQTASRASVWWLQNPTKPFEALTTALI